MNAHQAGMVMCEICKQPMAADEVLRHTDEHIAKQQNVVPDMMEEIIGWRAWAVEQRGDELELRSTTWTFVWPKKAWAVATCAVQTNRHNPPGEKCSCGLYAATSRDQLLAMRYYQFRAEYDFVIGEVGLAGKVIPGTRGWRAEKARVAKVYVPYPRWRLADLIMDQFGVPVQLGDTLVPEDDEGD
jgi:hypothetical protein